MKIVYNNILPFGRFTAIMLFGVIFAKRKPLSARTIRHEKIHVAQAKDCRWWLWFYLQYLWQWITVGFKYRKIPFEIEAYENDDNVRYLEFRCYKAWRLYE